jgi:hypothetical protein
LFHLVTFEWRMTGVECVSVIVFDYHLKPLPLIAVPQLPQSPLAKPCQFRAASHCLQTDAGNSRNE